MHNIRQYFVISLSVLIVAVIVLSISGTSNMFKLLSTLNACIATLFLFTYQDRPYSLHKIVNLFILFFFVIANAIQFSTNTNVTTFPITVCAADSYYYEKFQILVLAILVLFNFLYPLFYVPSQNRDEEYIPISNNRRLLIISLFGLFCTVVYYKNALLLMFVRGLASSDGGEIAELGGGNVGMLLFDKVIRALPFACYLWAAHYRVQKRVQIVLLLIMLITLFPTALARNATAMYWLPVVFLLSNFIKRKNVFVLVMLLGILVVFPLLENFRHWSGSFVIGLSFDFLNEMHFDASQNFMIIMKHRIVTWGWQLLGALLFWFPRSLWEAKPVGSGHFVAGNYSDFTNISMPWFAEGYINFGYVGIAVFTMVLSWFCSFYDCKYWNNSDEKRKITPYYLLLLSSLLFILRGDLMSSLAYTLATVFDLFIVYKLSISSTSRCKMVK